MYVRDTIKLYGVEVRMMVQKPKPMLYEARKKHIHFVRVTHSSIHTDLLAVLQC